LIIVAVKITEACEVFQGCPMGFQKALNNNEMLLGIAVLEKAS